MPPSSLCHNILVAHNSLFHLGVERSVLSLQTHEAMVLKKIRKSLTGRRQKKKGGPARPVEPEEVRGGRRSRLHGELGMPS